jgi:molecular chaperone GrpE
MEENIEKIEDNFEDEIVYDEDESVQDVVKKLKEKIQKLKTEKEEYLNNWQRERADFINFKKEEDSRLERRALLTKESVLESLIPILDSFSVAFQNKEVWEKVDENWRKGIEYIHQQFIQVLKDNNVKEIIPNLLDEFNPQIHQAIEERHTDDENEKGKILEVIQKGYSIGEYIVRPVRVIIGK